MDIFEAIRRNMIKGLDRLGQVRLNQNDGTRLPYGQAPEELAEIIRIVKAHAADKVNPHAVTDAQVYTGKSGSIHFVDSDGQTIDIFIVNGRTTSLLIDGDEQLS